MKRNEIKDSPVEIERKKMKRGNADWPGFDSVYSKLMEAAEKMSNSTYVHLGKNHVRIMAAAGSGNEEEMKSALEWCRLHDWI